MSAARTRQAAAARKRKATDLKAAATRKRRAGATKASPATRTRGAARNTGSVKRRTPSVIPMISYEDGVGALEWLARAFGFRRRPV